MPDEDVYTISEEGPDYPRPMVVTCTECLGYGEILVQPDDTAPCPVCSGDGFILEGEQY